jgi:hypothetical protein
MSISPFFKAPIHDSLSFSQNDPVTGLARNFDTKLIRNQGHIDALEQAGQPVHGNAIDAEPWTETQSMSPYPYLLKIIAAVVCFGVGTNLSIYERLTERT